MGAQQPGVVGECRAGPHQGVGRESTRGVDTLAEPDDAHLAMNVAEPAVGEIGDQQADGVGSAVDRGDPAMRAPAPTVLSQMPAIAGSTASNASASSPKGLTPGPFASECAMTTCKHLTRSGMPPPEKVVPSDSTASRSAR